MRPGPSFLALALISAACSELPSRGLDSNGPADASGADAPEPLDADPNPDHVAPPGPRDGAAPDVTHADAETIDAAVADAVVEADAGAPPAEVVPGQSLATVDGNFRIGATFAETQLDNGAPTRATPATGAVTPRSYEWTGAGEVTVTVWFADTDLSNTGVDPTDRVLWIAVEGAYSGRTAEGLGIGSAATGARAVFGDPDRTASVADPPGLVDAWYRRGVMLAHGDDQLIRTITVTRAYVAAPTATIDLAGGRVQFSPAIVGGAIRGSQPRDVTAALGEPDGRGPVTIDGTRLEVFSYAFIGVEVFFVDLLGSDRVAFTALHAPYFGSTQAGMGIGSRRLDLEGELSALGFDSGRATSANPNVICYPKSGSEKSFAATFETKTSAQQVTTMSIGFPSQACQ
ncbi:MAG: hypothetical protein HYV07_11985 [Deltaproteobacteria bacterium]|nr:hypothetical protein [Deltaproteobacteria bacterium]